MALFDWWRHNKSSRTSIQKDPSPQSHLIPTHGQVDLADQLSVSGVDTTHLDLTEDQREVLISLCNDCPIGVDSLPYTSEFKSIYREFRRQTEVRIFRHHVWRAICGLRKAGRLEKKGPAGSQPTISD